MRMLGLIGGMSWESTALYYRRINERVRAALGGLHSAPLLLYSFDFEEVAALQKAGRWDEAARRMADAGKALMRAGAEALVICTNTMHKVAEDVEALGMPLLHIADATGEAIRARGYVKAALLGTQFTMEDAFYRQRLSGRYALEVLAPDAGGREAVHRIIYEELCRGVVKPESRQVLEAVLQELRERGAQCAILGCTELCLILPEAEAGGLPLFDTTAIHADAAADYLIALNAPRAVA